MCPSADRVNDELRQAAKPERDGGYMRYGRITAALMALIATIGCNGGDVFKPGGPDGLTSPVSGARNGNLHTEKDCTNYFGLAGDTCTITKSNLREIGVGSLIHYVQATKSDVTANSDVVLDAGGSSKAFGHCTVNECVFNRGVGSFRSFSARLDVTTVHGVIGAWDGTYSFGQ
jgi:hypothetical protein